MVSPYGWDIPGGVQIHIRELAEHFIAQGHYVSVIAPVSDEDSIDDPWLVSAGRPVPIPFNGSVARVLFGPHCGRHGFDSGLPKGNLMSYICTSQGFPHYRFWHVGAAEGAMVGTFHASAPKLRAIATVGPLVEPMIEKLSARIAVSEMAQATLNNLYGTEAVVIPNGIDCSRFAGVRAVSASENLVVPQIGFLGRFEESRKGLPLLFEALPKVIKSIPDVQLLVAGPGDPTKLLSKLDSNIAKHITFLGRLTEDEKVDFLSGLSLYVAPNTGGESFGIILAESDGVRNSRPCK